MEGEFREGEFWVFAYGSLMWRPGFRPAETVPALIYGYHRALCIRSTRYRGTRETPGLVLGLERGGCCRGLALRAAAGREAAVRRALDARELLGPVHVYDSRFCRARLADGRRVTVYTYVVRRGQESHAYGLGVEETVAMVRQGVGERGTARDYLANTVARLAALGQPDRALERLLRRVDQAAETAGRARAR